MKIGIDFDDVVADSGIAIIERYNKKYGADFKKEHFKVPHFEKTWGITKEEKHREIDVFFTEDQLKNIGPVAGSLKAIKDLKTDRHELYIITARMNKDIERTELWIAAHLPNVFDGVHFQSSSRTEEIPRKKSEVCKELGIEVFIDDNPDHALDVATLGIKVFLFDQPWNREGEFPHNVERVHSWDEIVKKLNKH